MFIMAPTGIYYAMSRDGLFFRKIAARHPKYQSPHYAVILQAQWAIILILSRTFGGLLEYVVFCDWIFFGLTAGTLLIFRPEILAKIGRDAAKVGAWVLVDEIYLECLYGERPSSALLLGENFMVTSSLTKAYGLDGLRCGWMLGAEEIVKRVYYIYDLLGVIGSSPAECLSGLAFEHLGELQKRYKPMVNRNLSLVEKLVEGHQALEWSGPPGGLIGFVRLEGLQVKKLAEHLRRRCRTSIVPGRCFEEPEFFRLGFGGESEMVEQGLQNIRQALEELLP